MTAYETRKCQCGVTFYIGLGATRCNDCTGRTTDENERKCAICGEYKMFEAGADEDGVCDDCPGE